MPNKPLRAALFALACFTVTIVPAQSTRLINSAVSLVGARRTELQSRAAMATQQYGNSIKLNADEYGVDPALVVAVIMVESQGDAGAVSHSGAMGLMQLMPSVCSDFGVQDPFDPAQNIRGGVALLSRHLKKYSGDLRKVLAAYNAGPRRVDNGTWVKRGETRRYVPAVLSYYNAIHSDLASAPDYMRTGGPSTTGVFSSPAIGAGTTLDAMIQAIHAAKVAEDPSAVATENETLDDVAGTMISDYLADRVTSEGLDERLKSMLQSSSFDGRALHVTCFTTPKPDGFASTWKAQGMKGSIFGVAHGSRKGSHVWLVVSAE